MSADQTLQQYLASLKEGDLIFREAGANSLERVRVSRITATQIILITGGRYKRTTGKSIGTASGWNRSCIRQPTAATTAEWQRKFLANWALSPLPKIFQSLPEAQQAQLYRQIKGMEAAIERPDGTPAPATKPGDDEGIADSDSENREIRIEACISACEGYTTEQLRAMAGGNVKREVTKFADKLCDAQNRYLKAERHRDSLLAALKLLLEHEGTVVDTGIGEMESDELHEARKQAQIAIQEVEKAVDAV